MCRNENLEFIERVNLEYSDYVCKHISLVMKACESLRVYPHLAIEHDSIKLSEPEFSAYRDHFTIPRLLGTEPDARAKAAFDKAVLHHYRHNKHHWQHWAIIKGDNEPVEMPGVYVREMLADWVAMAMYFGGSAHNWYLENAENIQVHCRTRFYIERIFEWYPITRTVFDGMQK